MWDHEVDLISIGAGIGGLAGAVATVDAGDEVLVVDAAPAVGRGDSGVATRRRVGSRRGWMHAATADPETAEYFAGFAEWVPESTLVTPDVPVPMRVASPMSNGIAEPFLGRRLADWAATCLTSPYGMLYSNVFGWGRTTMRASTGGTIEVVPIGTVNWGQGAGASALRSWLTDRARDLGIEVLTDSPLDRLVFEDRRVVGAVFHTPSGPRAVRARRGVTVAPADQDWEAAGDWAPQDGESRQVCLVGRTASRFGRVELLTTAGASTAAVRPATCPATRQSLRTGLHEARALRSGLGLCRKVN
ncbi:hypothetical protein GCM10023114_10490 [Mycolicibacterium sediminis]|uniref:FAD-dependent oxidoreductase 2 FAD-binding domain-containing protein n=2 Tax=Mycolicibacterium sediminis TaxID=1286180 RepID=A0A7I7QSX0_9MYCO|nr:hypothetical protein MSEDJ_31830 [Mycolicibacterium sediminis]